MKVVKTNRFWWMVPALAAVIVGSGMHAVVAAPTEGIKASKAVKAPKPKSRSMEGTFSSANATMIRLKSKDGETNVNLVPTTQYWRIQTGLAATELKVDDMVKFTLKGTKGMATVQSLAPLTLKFDDVATLTIDKIGRTKFDRVNKLTANDLSVSQQAKVVSSVFADGKMEAREVWVIIKPAKPIKKTVVPKSAN